MFSKLHVDSKFYEDDYSCTCYMLDDRNDTKCLYDIKINQFLVDYYSIWRRFEYDCGHDYFDIKDFISDMLKEYFNLHDIHVSHLLFP